jgi:hypothetical protein
MWSRGHEFCLFLHMEPNVSRQDVGDDYEILIPVERDSFI